MAGDVICAVLPIVIIWRLTRSVVEKILVSILLGLGLVAAVGGVLKLVILKTWLPTSVHANRTLMDAFMWYVNPLTSPSRYASFFLLFPRVWRESWLMELTPRENRIRMEEILLIIGACAPTLKAPIEGFIRSRFGLPRFGLQSRASRMELDTVNTLPESSAGQGPSPWTGGWQASTSGESSGK